MIGLDSLLTVGASNSILGEHSLNCCSAAVLPSSLRVSMTYRQSYLQTSAASWLLSRSGGTKSSGLRAERLRAQELKYFIVHRVLASVLVGITPFAAFFFSEEVTGIANLVFILSFRGSEMVVTIEGSKPGLHFNDSLDRWLRSGTLVVII